MADADVAVAALASQSPSRFVTMNRCCNGSYFGCPPQRASCEPAVVGVRFFHLVVAEGRAKFYLECVGIITSRFQRLSVRNRSPAEARGWDCGPKRFGFCSNRTTHVVKTIRGPNAI